MIGDKDMAHRALSGEFSVFAFGSTRAVYLDHEAGVVYKVATLDDDSNNLEATRYEILRDMVEPPFAIPETTLYKFDEGDVIAMRFVSGQPMAACWCNDEPHTATCMPRKIVELAEKYIFDTTGENIVFDGDLYWIIDFPY